MLPQDYFVGGVAVFLGSFALVGALLNLDWYYQLKKARRIETRLGRRGARWFYALLGLGLIALGIAIACGFSPNKAAQRKLKSPPAEDVGPEAVLAVG